MELHAALASGGTHIKHYEHACLVQRKVINYKDITWYILQSSNLHSHVSAYIPNGVNNLCEVSRVHNFQRDSTQRKWSMGKLDFFSILWQNVTKKYRDALDYTMVRVQGKAPVTEVLFGNAFQLASPRHWCSDCLGTVIWRFSIFSQLKMVVVWGMENALFTKTQDGS